MNEMKWSSCFAPSLTRVLRSSTQLLSKGYATSSTSRKFLVKKRKGSTSRQHSFWRNLAGTHLFRIFFFLFSFTDVNTPVTFALSFPDIKQNHLSQFHKIV